MVAGRPTRLAASDSEGNESEYCADLSMIEWEIWDRMRRGLTKDAIAEELDLAAGAVELHIKQSLRKLRARSRMDVLSRIAARQ